MAFSFRLTFTGLCALVPRQLSLGERPQGRVLLVNARSSDDAPVEDLNLHTHLDSHDPAIEVHGLKTAIDNYDLWVEFLRADGSPGTTYPSELVPIDILPTPKPPAPRPDKEDDRDPYWIMDMAAINAGSVDNACFAASPTKVLARFKLTAGYLSTSRMVEDQNSGEDIIWTFRKSETATPYTSRPIAAEFAITCIADADKVVLVKRKFGSLNEERIDLTPVAGEIVLAVENLCYSPQEGDPKYLREISDFGWFYRLVAQQPPVLYLPYSPREGGLTDTMCPPARFPQHPDA
jgi:hypothetical protein